MRVIICRCFWVLWLSLWLYVSVGIAQTHHADTSTVEWIRVHFNMPADTSVAREGNVASHSVDLMKTLIEQIDQALYSIDLAAYDLENLRVGEALVRAANRGVRVRVVTDNYNRFDSREVDEKMWKMLRAAGIYSLDDAGDIFHPSGEILSHPLVGASYDMHHKFAVIDAKSSDPNDDYVWSGSTNITYTGNYNTNNSISIKDSGIAASYQAEFEQMWGGNGDKPVPENAQFHKDKRYIGENIFYVGNTKVELYFGPVNRDHSKPSIADRLRELILNYAEHDVNFVAFAITPNIPMSKVMWDRSAKGEITLHGIIDPGFYARYRNQGAIWGSPEAQQGYRKIIPGNELRKLHQKNLLIDVSRPFENDRGIAAAGSYNFSTNAELNNDENLLIFHDADIANQFYQDFKGAQKRALREADPPVPRLSSKAWYRVRSVEDSNRFEVELVPGFGYPVRFLGVQTPRIFAGTDSSDYFAGEAVEYIAGLIEDGEVRIIGPGLKDPQAQNGAYRGYIQVRRNGKTEDVNYLLLARGFGEWVPFYMQHPDSITAFKEYTKQAKENRVGMWEQLERVGEKIPRVELESDGNRLTISFPVNINIADEQTLQALPGIGPSYSERIVNYRVENGGFDSVEELINVQGIGETTMEKLRPNVTVE